MRKAAVPPCAAAAQNVVYVQQYCGFWWSVQVTPLKSRTICSHAQNVSRTLQKPDPNRCACEQLMCAGACLQQEMPTSDMTLTVVLLLPPLTDPVQVDLIDHSHYHHDAHHHTETCAENPQAL